MMMSLQTIQGFKNCLVQMSHRPLLTIHFSRARNLRISDIEGNEMLQMVFPRSHAL